MLTITFLGSFNVVLGLNILLSILFIKAKKWKYLITMIMSSLSDLAIIEPLKVLFAESRPIGGLVAETSFSFPSGHSYTAVVFYGLLTYFLWKRYRNKFVVMGGGIFVLLIAYSRIYLGVHYWWDVAAGLALGTTWLILTIRTLKTF